jgi:hypothetical protein
MSDDWRDISSAPRDGSDVYLPLEWTRVRAYWCDDLKTWVLARPLHLESIRDPKQWMPLPETKRANVVEAVCARCGELKTEHFKDGRGGRGCIAFVSAEQMEIRKATLWPTGSGHQPQTTRDPGLPPSGGSSGKREP